ncbi:MAG: hypothetical protein KAY37_15620 [Phycisphaerae bacterium]|nr:hypothetical protein [Phycisphaerae bacterium]
MVMEAHMGARAGRPRLMLTTSAAMLAVTLGLAWLQKEHARALGPEQQVDDTPLRVRLPRDWQADPDHPQRFLLPIKEEGRRRHFEFERRIRFEYDRLPAFRSVEQLLHFMKLDDPRVVVNIRPARIGPYAAVEVEIIGSQSIGLMQVVRRVILVRFACLPNGRLIQVVYEPLVDLRPADSEILDEVCDTLRVEEPALSGTPDDYLHRAGITLPLDDDWQVVGPALEHVPGVYVGGVEDGIPAWSLGIFRTWLATGRKPVDLLEDIAAEHWPLLEERPELWETRGADGGTITTLKHPRFGRADVKMPAVWVVEKSPSLAVIMFLYAGPNEADLANEAAGRIAAGLEIRPLVTIPEVATAEAAGQGLVTELNKEGPKTRWGFLQSRVNYTGQSLFGNETKAVYREALRRDPQRGYKGWRKRWTISPRAAFPKLRPGRENKKKLVQHSNWNIDGDAGAYEWSDDFYYQSLHIDVLERRDGPQAPVVRDVTYHDRAKQRWTYQPGPGFVPPPLEEIIAGWVARNEAETAIIEVSSRLGPGTHTLLLRHLPPDGDYPRVLVQQDFHPTGMIHAFDDDQAETHYERYPHAEYRRMD